MWITLCFGAGGLVVARSCLDIEHFFAGGGDVGVHVLAGVEA